VRRELLYRLHPWFGRDVFVHGATERANGVFRCTLDSSDIARSLEIPAWMFDCAACVSDVCIEAKPFVDLEALGALSALLDRVLKTDSPSSNARLRDAYGPLATRIGERAMVRKTTVSAIGIRSKSWSGSQQMDLFASSGAVVAPDWSDLPEDARGTLLGLMTRLILDHAQAAATVIKAEGGHDR
jgi:hypothetical protein